MQRRLRLTEADLVILLQALLAQLELLSIQDPVNWYEVSEVYNMAWRLAFSRPGHSHQSLYTYDLQFRSHLGNMKDQIEQKIAEFKEVQHGESSPEH